MVPTEVTETSTLSIHTPGNYPKEENTRYSQHGESLKTRFYESAYSILMLSRHLLVPAGAVIKSFLSLRSSICPSVPQQLEIRRLRLWRMVQNYGTISIFILKSDKRTDTLHVRYACLCTSPMYFAKFWSKWKVFRGKTKPWRRLKRLFCLS
jgi:hypothetical protein